MEKINVEMLTVMSLVIIAVGSLYWLGADAKDIVLAVGSGLIGFLTGAKS